MELRRRAARRHPTTGTAVPPTPPEELLKVDDLHTYFRTPAGVVRAIQGVTFSLNAGEMLGIVGQSGAGKSVLARCLMGLVRPPGRIERGSIRFQGRELVGMSDAELNGLRGAEMAIIVSNPRSRLNPLLPVGQQVADVIRAKQPLSKAAASELAVNLFRSVAIADPQRVARLLPDELSGGMCQRVIIAIALSNSPRLLIADEPTAGLDVTVAMQVLQLMERLVSDTGTALILMTRDLGVVAHFSERVVVLQKGTIAEDRGVQEFFEHPRHPHSKALLESAFASRGVRDT